RLILGWSRAARGRSRIRAPPGILRTYGKPVLDLDNAGRRPGRSFGLLVFGPGPHSAVEDDHAVIGFDFDAIGVDLGAAPERLFDPALDLARRRARLHADQVADPL